MICMTWNLGRRNHPGQLDLIRDAGADIVALQEVSAARRATLASDLAALGLVHQHGSAATSRAFPFTSMIASRWPVAAAGAEQLEIPFPERVQVVIVTTPFGDVEALNVHVPAATSSGVAVKVATLEGIARYLARTAPVPRIVCGDFNTPKSEIAGHVAFWGSAHQQHAERAVIQGEASTGLRDAFRHVNGPGAAAASWRAANRVARRYDHVFASQELVPVEATYGDLERITTAKVGDHASLRVVFRPAPDASMTLATRAVMPSAAVPVTRTAAEPLSSAIATKEKAMTKAESADLNAFLMGLTYKTDVRKDPDNRRRGQFRAGWSKATDGGTISNEKLSAELSWHNLGFRAGRAYGQATPTMVDCVFDRFVAIYLHKQV